MSESFFSNPILNSPYEAPARHHPLDKDGQPLDQPPVDGRRKSELITPVPKPRKQQKKAGPDQASFVLSGPEGLSTVEQEYNPTPIINEIRQHLATWREIPNPADWGVTPATAQLLKHWRHHNFQGVRPFFCQVEAAETAIWLTEVARSQAKYKRIWGHIEGANNGSNPELMRLALKMATGRRPGDAAAGDGWRLFQSAPACEAGDNRAPIGRPRPTSFNPRPRVRRAT